VSEEALPGGPPWWSNAIFYQVYPRSFADSNGDGVGDLDGLVAHLDHLSMLGIDAIWLNPVNVSPMADHGYDVSDPRDVDPLFGGLEALERLIAQAHGRDIRVTMDLVPNHTSSQHAWFQAALSAGPGSAERARYIFRDGRGDPGGPPRGQERSDPGKDPRRAGAQRPGKTPPEKQSTPAMPGVRAGGGALWRVVGQTARTPVACGPLGLWPTSNSTL